MKATNLADLQRIDAIEMQLLEVLQRLDALEKPKPEPFYSEITIAKSIARELGIDWAQATLRTGTGLLVRGRASALRQRIFVVMQERGYPVSVISKAFGSGHSGVTGSLKRWRSQQRKAVA